MNRKQPRRQAPPAWLRRWTWPLVGVAVAVLLALVGLNHLLNSGPPQPDEAAVHADIAAGRSGAEVTFVGTVTADPVKSGDHEQIQVQDSLGDQLELDYNLALGRWIPARAGDRLTVHGQLYIDAGRSGVHCLHSQTSRGCPLPGWIVLAGTTYS